MRICICLVHKILVFFRFSRLFLLFLQLLNSLYLLLFCSTWATYFVHSSSIISPSSLRVKCVYFFFDLLNLNILNALSRSYLSSYLWIYFIICVAFTDPATPRLHRFLIKLIAPSSPNLCFSMLYSLRLF